VSNIFSYTKQPLPNFKPTQEYIMKTIGAVLMLSFSIINAYASEPDPVKVKYDACVKMMEAQPPAQAIPCFESVLEMDTMSVSAMYYLGKLYLQTKNYDKAVESFENLLEIEPSDQWAINAYIPSLDGAGMNEKALKVAEKAAAEFPEYAGFHAYLIRRYQARDETDKVYKAREDLLSLVRSGHYEGLSSEKMYVRDTFKVGEVLVYGIEYFRSGENSPQIFSFITTYPDGKEIKYVLSYNKLMEEMVRKKHGADALPYFFDAFDGRQQSLVTAFTHEPKFEELKEVVKKDLIEDRKSFRACVESPISTKPVPCE